MSEPARALVNMYEDRGLRSHAAVVREERDPGGGVHEVVYLDTRQINPAGIRRELSFLDTATPQLAKMRGIIPDLERYRSKLANTTITYRKLRTSLRHHVSGLYRAVHNLPDEDLNEMLPALSDEGQGLVRHLKCVASLKVSNQREVDEAEAAQREYPILERRIYGSVSRLAHALAAEIPHGVVVDKVVDESHLKDMLRTARRVLRKV